MNDELQEIVEKMVQAGESEEDIALVIREYKPQEAPAKSPSNPRSLDSFLNTVADPVNAMVGGFNRGVIQGVAAPFKLAGDVQRAAASAIGYPEGLDIPFDVGNIGRDIETFTEKVNPRYENVNDFAQSVAEGVGQIVPMVATAGASAEAKGLQMANESAGLLPATGRAVKEVAGHIQTPTGLLGGAMTAVPEWDEAKAAGLSDEAAFGVLVKNFLVGTTDAIAVENGLTALNKVMKGALMERVKAAGTGGLLEFAQEGVQTYLTNKVAQSDYDPDRDPMFQVLESAEVGGVVGMFIPAIGGAFSYASAAKKQKLSEKLAVLAARAEIVQADTGNPTVNATIDKQTAEITKSLDVTTTKGILDTPAPSVQPTTKIEQTDPLTITESTIPIWDEQGNKTGTKPAHHFTFSLPGVGDAKGVIVGKKASILEINAATDPSGEPKKGGQLYRKVVNRLKKQGVNQFTVGVQSAASTASLQSMLKNGRISVTPGSIDAGEIDVQGNPVRFNIESDLVSDFDDTGVLLGGAEESKSATRAAASEQIADFLRDKVKTRGDVVNFQDDWNRKHPERQITDKEALSAWELIRPAKVDKGETVTAPINELLKHQIKTFYRGMEKGVRKGQKLVNETLIPKVQEALKTAKLTARQTSAILTRLKTSNLFTPGSASKLNTFIDKVVGDAQYAEKLAEAKSLKKRIKKFGRQKNTSEVPVEYKVLARSFAQINPDEVKDLDEFLDKAQSVINPFRPIDKGYAPVNKAEMEDYIQKILDDQEEEAEKELADVDEKNIEEIKTIAQASTERLAEKDLSGFDASAIASIGIIKKIDLDQLSPEQLKRYIKIVDNIVENDDLSGETFIEDIAAVQEFVGKLTEMVKGAKTSEIGQWAKVFNNISNMTKRIWQNSKIEDYFRSFVHGPLLTAGSQTEKLLVDASARFDQDVTAANKTFKKELRDINNKADQAVFALLYQMDNESDLNKMHRNIRETIRRHNAAGNTNEAAAWQQAYDAFKDIKSWQEALTVIKQKNPGVYKLWQTFGNDGQPTAPIFTEQIAADQARVTKELHNREHVPVSRYTPIVQHEVNNLFRSAKQVEEGDHASSSKTITPKQARTAKRRTLNLRANSVYTLEVYNDWILRYGETIYDNKASKTESRMAEFMKHPSYAALVGGADNAVALNEAFVRMRDIQRGTNRLVEDNEAENLFTEIAKTLRVIGTVKALASFSQAIKQSTVMVKLATNLMVEGDSEVLPAAIHAVASIKKNEENGVKKLLDQSTLIARGLRMGGTDRGTAEAYKLQRGATKTFYKWLERRRVRFDKNTRQSLARLVKPDVFNARTAFIAYYLQSLKHQGMKDIDLNTEHARLNEPERKTAMAHAENMIEKTQTASNPAAMSAIQAQTKSKGWEFVKTVFLPFSTFDADFKARFVIEASAVRREPTTENALRLAGTVGEALTFAALNAFALYWYKEWLRKGVAYATGNEREEKQGATIIDLLTGDFDKINKEQRQQFLSSTINAINPISIGTVPQEMQARAINEVGFQIASADDPELTKKDWLKTNSLVYEPREGTLLENLGAYSTGIASAIDASRNIVQIVKAGALDKPIKVVDAYGNEKMVSLTGDEKKLLALKTLAETLALSGITESDIANAIRTVYREEMKKAKPADQQTKPTTKSFKRKRKPFKRQ